MARKKKSSSNKVIKLVKKSNELVESQYKFDIWEIRIFTTMVTMIKYDDQDFKPYRIYLNDVISEYGLENSKDSYARLKKAANKLMKKVIKFVRKKEDGKLYETTAPLAIWIDTPLRKEEHEDASFIDISFHPGMKPHLISLQSHFTMYDSKYILKLSSGYSIRIYELLKQYEKIRKRVFDLEDFKKKIGCIEEIDEDGKTIEKDYYPKFWNLKQRILLKAQKDLEKYTDISFDFTPLKKWRKFYAIEFEIKTNRKIKGTKATVAPELTNTPPTPLLGTLFPKIQYAVTELQFRERLEQFGEQKVQDCVEYTLDQITKGTTIKNMGAYIMTLLKQDSLFIAEDSTQAKQEHLEREQHIKELEEEQDKQHKKRELERDLQTLHDYLERNPDFKETIVDELMGQPLAKYKKSESFEWNITTNTYFQTYLVSWIRRKHSEILN